MKLVVAVVLVAGCLRGEHRAARDKYNEGVAALVANDYDAAEKALLEARSTAGVDPELRFRAAFDLGMAYSAHADKAKAGLVEKDGKKEPPDLAKALSLEQSAASWFSDALRLRQDDEDTKANLAIVRARVQAISDELRKAEGKLEARLDKVIAEQRRVLDGSRDAWLTIKLAHGADPLAEQQGLTHLADLERGIVAEAGVIGDLAGDDIDAIGKKPEDKRTDEEKVRVVQLKNLDLYLVEGRDRIAEARRKLQDLAAEEAVGQAEAALVALKRAREQLLDPIAVMREVATDQVAVYTDTDHSQKAAGLDVTAADKDKPALLPTWLTPIAIAQRENGLHERLEEVRARLAAGVEHGKDVKDPQQQKLLERVAAALPAVTEATAAMDRAHQALVGKRLEPAKEAEGDALVALTRAIEQFSDLKQTIELAWQSHQEQLALLSPEAEKKLTPQERAKRTRDTLAANLARMPRLQELIADEVAQLDKQPADPKQDPKQAEAAKQHAEQAKQQLAEAEKLRGEADTALRALDKALTGNKDPLAPAKEADAKLSDLRKLFFSVIEHLKELLREQAETRDQTSTASGEDDFARAPKLPGLVDRETGHGQMAKAITEVLSKQADAAGKQPPQPGAPDAKALAAATDEVRQAETDMGSAEQTLVKARDTKTSSESLKPAVTSQGKAVEHLEAALKLLEPPKQQDDKKQDDKKQQPQPQPQGGAGQRARDEDARRQKERHKQDNGPDPVDKDW